MSRPLVSVGLPVRNAAGRVAEVVRSVLAQDHEHLELVISDNASTDATEEVCRALAREDARIAYHRQPEDIGLVANFVFVLHRAQGKFIRWIGDDDRLAPGYVSRMVRVFAADPRLVLVTSQIAYIEPDGDVRSAEYAGTALGSDDPVVRFAEMLRLLNESYLLIDPNYGLFRRSVAASMARPNMLREDEVFAARMALAGPWAHVGEALASRHRSEHTDAAISQRLGVPPWHARVVTALERRELLRATREFALDGAQRAAARAAINQWYLRRHRRIVEHRARKVARLVQGRR